MFSDQIEVQKVCSHALSSVAFWGGLGDWILNFEDNNLSTLILKIPSNPVFAFQVPQIFVNGKFVGGYTEMEQLKDAGKLIELIHQCATSRQ